MSTGNKSKLKTTLAYGLPAILGTGLVALVFIIKGMPDVLVVPIIVVVCIICIFYFLRLMVWAINLYERQWRAIYTARTAKGVLAHFLACLFLSMLFACVAGWFAYREAQDPKEYGLFGGPLWSLLFILVMICVGAFAFFMSFGAFIHRIVKELKRQLGNTRR